MVKIIFRNTLIMGILVLLICALLFLGLQYRRTINEAYDELKLVSTYLEDRSVEQADTLYKEVLGKELRVTTTDADGNVLFDSEYGTELKNQKDCKEIAEAIEKGEGRSSRKSESSGQLTVYYAEKKDDGTVLRVSQPVSSLYDAFVAVSPVLWVVVLVLVISGILAFKMSNQIVTPINELNLDEGSDNAYPELKPLLDKIQEQKFTIQEEASAREVMRQEFSVNISRELKAPVTAMASAAEALLSEETSEEEKTAAVSNIDKEAHHLSALIDDIDQLTRLDEKSVEFAKETVDLHALSEEVVKDLRETAEKNYVSMEIKGKPVLIQGTRKLLYEMIYNLTDNAIKYNYPGGKVTLETVEDASSVRYSVADTGIGIPKEAQARVFERFYRVDKSLSGDKGGTGLGLSIVKHGAAYHNAEVEMESEEGKGTKITLVFPKA